MQSGSKRLYIISAVVILLLVVIIILIVLRNKGKLSIGGRRASSAFKRRLIDNALQEYANWGNGTIKESSPDQLNLLHKYWSDGAGVNYRGQQAVSNPWSAALISYVMKKSGAENDFPYSASHSTYITKSIQHRKNNSSNPFKGYRVNEVYIEPGDLACYSRAGSGATYETTGGYESHCDLVVKISSDNAESIGGNVSNSVSKTIIPLVNRKIDLGRTTKPYFVVIKNEK